MIKNKLLCAIKLEHILTEGNDLTELRAHIPINNKRESPYKPVCVHLIYFRTFVCNRILQYVVAELLNTS